MQMLNPECLLFISNEKNNLSIFLRNKGVKYVIILQMMVKKDCYLDEDRQEMVQIND